MDFKKLAKLVRQYDKEVLAAEIENCGEEVETIDDLIEYLEDELNYVKCCDNCDNLIALGEGGFICYECDEHIIPISNYQPTDMYLKCEGRSFTNKRHKSHLLKSH